MVGGYVRKVTEESDLVTLRVQGTGCEKYDECDVRIKKDGKRTDWFTNALGKTSMTVWWQGTKLFASFGELSGFEFEKIGNATNPKKAVDKKCWLCGKHYNSCCG